MIQKNISRRIARHNEEIFKLATNIEKAEIAGDAEKAAHLTQRFMLHKMALVRVESQFNAERKPFIMEEKEPEFQNDLEQSGPTIQDVMDAITTLTNPKVIKALKVAKFVSEMNYPGKDEMEKRLKPLWDEIVRKI